MKVVIAPDSYKGSLSALKVAQAMGRGIHRVDPNTVLVLLPMADGGEGTVEALVEALHGQIVRLPVTGPLGETVEAFYGLSPDGKTAIIEMAAASGLPLVPPEKRNPYITTTYGTGELMKAALDRGCRRMIIGIGGSATNDGGVGMAQALGYRFLDKDGRELPFGGEALLRLDRIDVSQRDKRLDEAEIIVACDVDTPLCGEEGAAAIFGPQKGATPEMVRVLDEALRNLGDKIKQTFHRDVFSIPGGGAAGGLGAGLVAFAGAQLKKGIDIVMDLCGFDEKVKDADLVLTGEGNTDFQTVMGKTPTGVALRAKKYGCPVICVSGGLGKRYRDIYEYGIDAAFSIMPHPASLEDAFAHGEIWLEETVESIFRVFLQSPGMKSQN